MSNITKVERQIAGRTLSIETGHLAKQASGAVVVRYDDSVVFVAAVSSDPREGIDFFPLTVDYREKLSAAGKFPGGFIKREGRPTMKEVLTMRMIDRPHRPLFPKGFRDEVQIQAMVWSTALKNDPDVLAIIGASAALAISDIPFNDPLGAVRVGYLDDQLVINPTLKQQEESSLELLMCGLPEGVNMIEVASHELSEEIITEALELGHKSVVEISEMIRELRDKCGQEKYAYEVPDTSELVQLLKEKIGSRYLEAKAIPGKKERKKAVKAIFQEFEAELIPEGAEESAYTPELIRMAIEDFQEKVNRDEILQGRRADGRSYEQIRPISGEVAFLPHTHGSAVFTRGETQAMVTVTLGTSNDAQTVDGLLGEYDQRFMLHYNFPPFCVGECRRIMGPGRRELGHGALAEKSLNQILPDINDFPYTIKIVSDILESNGSSSMASVCGGTLALMDAGVPILHPVAGISVGMVSEGDRYELITDIIGEEDHYGDMDFKVAGTQKGITGIQLDLKRKFLTFDMIRKTFEQARQGRISILQSMLTVIDKPRPNISTYAPQMISMQIPVDMIGQVIGPGGREVKRIQEITGATVEIEDDGMVYFSCVGGDGHLKAKQMVELITQPIEVGRIYKGRVVSIKDFGAFVELAPGKEGLCHISELSDGYVNSVDDVCKMGDQDDYKVIALDQQGRIKLSRKAAMQEQQTS